MVRSPALIFSTTSTSGSPGARESTLIDQISEGASGRLDTELLEPDASGLVTAANVNYYINFWVAGDLGVADLTTQGAGVGDPGFGVPDGLVTAADVNYYINLWVAGCP